MSIAWMSSDLRLASHPQRVWCSLAQRAAEDGLDYRDFSWLQKSNTPLSKMTVLAHLWQILLWPACYVCQSLWKGTFLECVFWPIGRATSFLLLTVYGWRRNEDLTFYRPQAVLSICCFNFALLLNFRKTDIFAEVCRPPAWPTRFGVPSQISSVSHIGS